MATSATYLAGNLRDKAVPAGRPTNYRPEYCDLAWKYCLLGITDKQLAEMFDTSEQTLNAWKNEYPEFLEAIKEGRKTADARVAESLYKKALGCSHPESKIVMVDGAPEIITITKHHPPDTSAASLWLRNRQPERWRDQKEFTTKLTLDRVLSELEK